MEFVSEDGGGGSVTLRNRAANDIVDGPVIELLVSLDASMHDVKPQEFP